MKLLTIISATLFSLATYAKADSEPFGLIAIRSGSDLQYSSVFIQNGTLYFGHVGNSSFSGVVTDCGQLKFSDSTYALISSNGEVQETKNSLNAADGFAIQGGHLTFNHGNETFYAIPQQGSSNYLVSSMTAGNASLSVVIRAQGFSGSVVSDFHPTENCSNSSTKYSNHSKSSYSAGPSSTYGAINAHNEAGNIKILNSFELGSGVIAGIIALII